MPKAKKSTSANAPSPASPADALIETVRRGASRDLPPQAAMDALRKLIEYNDTASGPSKRVGIQAAVTMLTEHYGWEGGRYALDALCRKAFGRRSWGTP